MDQNLKEYLRSGESVCWSGRPENFAVLGGKNKGAIIGKSVAVVVVAAAMIAGHMASSGTPKTGLVVLLIAVAVVTCLSPIWQKMQLLKVRYWITDQRVIQLCKEGTFSSIELNEIDVFKVVNDGSIDGCLVLGSSVFEDAEKQMRWRANTPKDDKETSGRSDHAVGLILYHTSDVEGAVATLKSFGCAKAA